jgi:hypothetical protein
LELHFSKEPLQTSVPVEIQTFDYKLARKRTAQALLGSGSQLKKSMGPYSGTWRKGHKLLLPCAQRHKVRSQLKDGVAASQQDFL